MEDRLVTIARYLHPVEAELLRSRLEEHGVRCFLDNVALTHMAWQYSGATGGVKAVVRSGDLPLAEQILAEIADELADGEEPISRNDEGNVDERGHPTASGTIRSPKTSTGQGTEPTGEEYDDPPLNPREQIVERAYKAAILALFFAPLHFYAAWLLLCAADDEFPLQPRLQRRHRSALALHALLWILGSAFVWVAIIPHE